MATTPWRTAGTVSASIGSGFAWSDATPSTLANSDGADFDVSNKATATATGAGFTRGLRLTNFGFAADIPNDSTILGVEVQIERCSSNPNVEDYVIQLVGNNTGDTHLDWFGSNQMRLGVWSHGLIDRVDTYGGASDLWGLTSLNPTIPKHVLFGFDIIAAASDTSIIAIDHVQMRVHYSTPYEGGGVGVWNGVAWVQKPVKVWNGVEWVEKPLKVWNGSAWVTA